MGLLCATCARAWACTRERSRALEPTGPLSATFAGKGKLNSLLNLREEELDSMFPTYAHMACQALIAAGHAKFVVTSNHVRPPIHSPRCRFHRGVGWVGGDKDVV